MHQHTTPPPSEPTPIPVIVESENPINIVVNQDLKPEDSQSSQQNTNPTTTTKGPKRRSKKQSRNQNHKKRHQDQPPKKLQNSQFSKNSQGQSQTTVTRPPQSLSGSFSNQQAGGNTQPAFNFEPHSSLDQPTPHQPVTSTIYNQNLLDRESSNPSSYNLIDDPNSKLDSTTAHTAPFTQLPIDLSDPRSESTKSPVPPAEVQTSEIHTFPAPPPPPPPALRIQYSPIIESIERRRDQALAITVYGFRSRFPDIEHVLDPLNKLVRETLKLSEFKKHNTKDKNYIRFMHKEIPEFQKKFRQTKYRFFMNFMGIASFVWAVLAVGSTAFILMGENIAKPSVYGPLLIAVGCVIVGICCSLLLKYYFNKKNHHLTISPEVGSLSFLAFTISSIFLPDLRWASIIITTGVGTIVGFLTTLDNIIENKTHQHIKNFIETQNNPGGTLKYDLDLTEKLILGTYTLISGACALVMAHYGSKLQLVLSTAITGVPGSMGLGLESLMMYPLYGLMIFITTAVISTAVSKVAELIQERKGIEFI